MLAEKLILLILVAVCVLNVSQSVGPGHNRGFRYIMGQPVEECPEGTHSYSGREMGPTWSSRTCSSPVAYDMGGIADLSRCDCDEPTVLDETTKKCVNLEDCPPQPISPYQIECLRSY